MSSSLSHHSPGFSLFTYLHSEVGTRLEPFDCTKATLAHISHTIEDLIVREQLPAIVLTGFQEADHWRTEAKRYQALAEVAQQVCIFATDLPDPDTYVRETRVTLAEGDPLRHEWFVCAVTPSISIVLCGQDRYVTTMGEATRPFHAFWSFEPEVVTQALTLLEGVVGHYRPERLADLQRARMHVPPTHPDVRLMARLLREFIRFEDQLQHTIHEHVDARTVELRAALSRAEALYAITNDAIASDNLIEALQRAVDRASVTINSDRMALLIFDWEARSIEHFLYSGRGKEHVFTGIDFNEFMSGLTGWAVRERRPAISPKHIPDPRESSAVQQRRIATESGSIAVLPLIYLDEVFGTLTAINQPDEPDFTPEDVDLLGAIAGQIALAYARMRLTTHLQRANSALSHEVRERIALSQQLEQQAERATAVATLSRVLAEANRALQPLFDTIAEQTVQLIGDACLLTLLTLDHQSMEIVAFSHVHPEGMAMMRTLAGSPYPAHVGMTGQVVQRAQPLLLPQAAPETIRAQLKPEYLPFFDRFGIASMLIVPLRAHGRVLGTLGITRDRHGQPYTEADQVFLQDLADRAGLAIENARLFAVAEQARAEAERANRAKDEFLATMSHELRTPINAILSYSESLHDDVYGPLTERQHGAVDAVEAAGQHLLTLINDILDLAKVEAGRLELQIQPVSLDTICQASLGLVREQVLKKGLRLEFHCNDPQAMLEGEPTRLTQMLVNLLSNAVKFTPNEGTVGLEVSVDGAAHVVRFVVYDTGIGIAPADLGRLFQPFSQLDSALNRAYEGTGLGLALVRRLAELHGGAVTVESTLGQGSRFTITLPYRPLSEVPAAGADSLRAPPSSAGSLTALNRHRAHILLVEDNEANIGPLRDYLDARGCAVVVARDGHEALLRADEVQPQLILMDIQMSGMDGLAAIRLLRTQPAHAATPIIALTALAMPGDKERCLEAGATAYMTKPVRLRTLMETIQQLLDG